MFPVICPLGAEEPHTMKLARIFVQWIETRLHDSLPADLDPDRALQLEEAYMLMLQDIPTWTLRQRMSALAQEWAHLPADEPDHPRPAPP